VLLKAGYKPGPIDGVLGGSTMEAVNVYQRAEGLASGKLTGCRPMSAPRRDLPESAFRLQNNLTPRIRKLLEGWSVLSADSCPSILLRH